MVHDVILFYVLTILSIAKIM